MRELGTARLAYLYHMAHLPEGEEALPLSAFMWFPFPDQQEEIPANVPKVPEGLMEARLMEKRIKYLASKNPDGIPSQ